MSASKEPPGLPNVIDEAGETPGWVPMVGLAVLILVGLYIAMGQAHAPATGAAEEPAAEAEVAADEPKPEGDKPEGTVKLAAPKEP